MIAVKATREGLQGSKTATGYRVETSVPFVALPSTAALRLWVRVFYGGKTVKALVLDVGPWNEHDHAYVFQALTLGLIGPEVRPQAETGIDALGRVTNHAGIDLGEKVWKTLGMTDNGMVSWEFV